MSSFKGFVVHVTVGAEIRCAMKPRKVVEGADLNKKMATACVFVCV